MSYYRLKNGNVSASLRALAAGKFLFSEYSEGSLDVDESGVIIKEWEYDTELRVFRTVPNIQLGRNLVVVTPNPAIADVLGFQPGCPVTISPGFWGQLEVGIGLATEEALELVHERLEKDGWLVKLTYLVGS